MKRAPEKLLKALLEAERLQAANKRNKALQAARQAYRLALDYLPVGHPERRRAARVLGLVLKALNQHSEADRLLRECGDLQPEENLVREVTRRNQELSERLQQGVTPQLAQLAAENLELAILELEPDSDGTLGALTNLGRLSKQMGHLREAEKVFSEVVNLRRRAGQQGQPLLDALMDLAQIYEASGRDSKGLALREEAVDIRARGEQDFQLAMMFHQMAMICLASKRPQQALHRFQQSLQLRRSLFGEKHPETAVAVRQLALAYVDLQDHARAQEALQEAWTLSQQSLGADHPQTLQFQAERGLHLITTGAEDRLHEGLEMVRQAQSRAEELPFEEWVHDQLRKTRDAAEEISRGRILEAKQTSV